MKKNVRIIFHIDLNAFFATCAMIKEPYLKNKVFVVGGPGSSARGVISTASYNARKYGIRAGMSVSEALKLYNRLLIVPTDFRMYREKSEAFMNLLSEYSDTILQGSIDEAYLDVTKLALEKHPLEIAKEIQKRLVDEHQLPSSIGIAPTLFLAKMASDLKKPLGITVLRKRDIEKMLYPLDVADIFGIGKQTYPKLKQLGIETIADFMNQTNYEKILKVMKSDSYDGYKMHILGQSSNTIEPDKYRLPKSISSETTFNYDVSDDVIILDEIHRQLDDCIRRMNRYEMMAKTVGFKLKKTDFTIITRSVTLNEHSNDLIVIKDALDNLFEESYSNEKIRLAGAHLSNLVLKTDKKLPFNLFTYEKFISEL